MSARSIVPVAEFTVGEHGGLCAARGDRVASASRRCAVAAVEKIRVDSSEEEPSTGLIAIAEAVDDRLRGGIIAVIRSLRPGKPGVEIRRNDLLRGDDPQVATGGAFGIHLKAADGVGGVHEVEC